MKWYKDLQSVLVMAPFAPFLLFYTMYLYCMYGIHQNNSKIVLKFSNFFVALREYSFHSSWFSHTGPYLPVNQNLTPLFWVRYQMLKLILNMCFCIVSQLSLMSPQEITILLRFKTFPIGSLSYYVLCNHITL